MPGPLPWLAVPGGCLSWVGSRLHKESCQRPHPAPSEKRTELRIASRIRMGPVCQEAEYLPVRWDPESIRDLESLDLQPLLFVPCERDRQLLEFGVHLYCGCVQRPSQYITVK